MDKLQFCYHDGCGNCGISMDIRNTTLVHFESTKVSYSERNKPLDVLVMRIKYLYDKYYIQINDGLLDLGFARSLAAYNRIYLSNKGITINS